MSRHLSVEFYGQFFLYFVKLTELQHKLTTYTKNESERAEVAAELSLAQSEFQELIDGLLVESYEDLIQKTEAIVHMARNLNQQSIPLDTLRKTYIAEIDLAECECDNTHLQNNTVCLWCWSLGRREPNDPDVGFVG
jgi:hypothetical protein